MIASIRADHQRQQLEKLMMPIFQEIDRYEIPAGKEKTVIAYTLMYYSKNRHMRNTRIVQKVVDQFKLKLKS